MRHFYFCLLATFLSLFYASAQEPVVIIDLTSDTGAEGKTYLSNEVQFTVNYAENEFSFAVNNFNPSSGLVRGTNSASKNQCFYFYNTTPISGLSEIRLYYDEGAVLDDTKIFMQTDTSSIETYFDTGGNCYNDEEMKAVICTPEISQSFFRVQFVPGSTPDTNHSITKIEIFAGQQEYTKLSAYQNQTLTLREGRTLQLDLGTSHPEINFAYSTEGVAEISSDGLVTATAPGETTVTATWTENDNWFASDEAGVQFAIKVEAALDQFTDEITPALEYTTETTNNSNSGYNVYSTVSDLSGITYYAKTNKTTTTNPQYFTINTTPSGNSAYSGFTTGYVPENYRVESVTVKTVGGAGSLKVSFGNTPGEIVYTGEEEADMSKVENYFIAMNDAMQVIAQADAETDGDETNPTFTFYPTPETYRHLLIQTERGAVQLLSIAITYTYEGELESVLHPCATPVFTPASGAYVYASETVTISTSTEDATIFYTIEDGEPRQYDPTTGITFEEDGLYTISAWAEKEGMLNSRAAKAQFTYCSENIYEKYIAQRVTKESQIEDGALYVIVGRNATREIYETMTDNEHANHYFTVTDVTGRVDNENLTIEIADGMAFVRFEQDDEGWYLNINGARSEARYIKSIWRDRNNNNVTTTDTREPAALAQISLVTNSAGEIVAQIAYPEVTYTTTVQGENPEDGDSEGETSQEAVEVELTATPMLQYNANAGDNNIVSRFTLYDNTLVYPYLYRLYLPFEMTYEAAWQVNPEVLPDELPFEPVDGFEIETNDANSLSLNVNFTSEEGAEAEEVNIELGENQWSLRGELAEGSFKANYLEYETILEPAAIHAVVNGERTVTHLMHIANSDALYLADDFSHSASILNEGYAYDITDWNGLEQTAKVHASFQYAYDHNGHGDTHFVTEFHLDNFEYEDAEVTYYSDTHTAIVRNFMTMHGMREDWIGDFAKLERPKMTTATRLHFPFIYLDEPQVGGTGTLRKLAARNAADFKTAVYSTPIERSSLDTPDPDNDSTTTGVENVAADANASAEYYNLQGIRIDNPRPGTTVIRKQGSEAVKILMK